MSSHEEFSALDANFSGELCQQPNHFIDACSKRDRIARHLIGIHHVYLSVGNLEMNRLHSLVRPGRSERICSSTQYIKVHLSMDAT